MKTTNFVSLKSALELARRRQIALGAFEFWSYEVARAIVAAAGELDVPVILQCGQMEIERMGGVEEAVETAHMAAKRATVPVVLHLDHATTFELCNAAVNAGFSSVMIDASGAPFAKNVALTRRVAQRAQPAGVSVEGELGRLAGEEGDLRGPEAAQTDPDEARRFVQETGVDALAVSIGTAHGQYTFAPHLNIARLDAIRARVDVPIVLHGGSGTPMAQVQEAIRHGIRKVNICTDIQIAMGRAYVAAQGRADFKFSARNLWEPAEVAAQALVSEKIRAFALLS